MRDTKVTGEKVTERRKKGFLVRLESPSLSHFLRCQTYESGKSSRQLVNSFAIFLLLLFQRLKHVDPSAYFPLIEEDE